MPFSSENAPIRLFFIYNKKETYWQPDDDLKKNLPEKGML
jgi:hypothetical protein